MLVTCIYNEDVEDSLTIGKQYEVICVVFEDFYNILNDNNEVKSYVRERFK